MDSGYTKLINKASTKAVNTIFKITSLIVFAIFTLKIITGSLSLIEYITVVCINAILAIMLKLISDGYTNKISVKAVQFIYFIIIYAVSLYIVDNQAMFAIAIPIVISVILYKDTIYTLLYNLSYLIIVMLTSLTDIISYGYNKNIMDVAVIQMIISVIIAISNIIVSNINISNSELQNEDLIDTKSTLEYYYTHDISTGLFNKNYLLNNSSKLINKSKLPISIAIININGMKVINDYYGTTAGDHVIASVGLLIYQMTNEKYTPIYLNSDEFMVIMQGVKEADAIDILENISHAVNNIDISIGISSIRVSIEYGITFINDENTNMDSSITLAKNIVYQKKMMNKNNVKGYLLESLKKALSESDFETEEHAERTKDMAVKLGKKLGLSDNEQSQLALLAILHDIGKMSIPREILVKPGKLTADEWEIMKTHSNKGFEVANDSVELRSIAEFILHHHERWDGTGYPSGLAGEEIPLLSRIITVVDSHDVMTHNRPYHKAMSQEDAKAELRRCSGTQFDPNIVTTFIDMIEEENSMEAS